jgi:hypothetical protein
MKDKDLEKIKKRIHRLGEIQQDNIAIPDKVIVSKSNLYYIYPFKKKKSFNEARSSYYPLG